MNDWIFFFYENVRQISVIIDNFFKDVFFCLLAY